MFPATDASTPMSSAQSAAGGAFATTHWSVVMAAGADSPASAAALEQLCRTYWYPLYAYVRRLGYPAHDAQDLTQAFFAELFRKNYFRAADRERGKFRSFLLTALRHFLSHEWEKGQAAKRGGGVAPLSLDEQTAEDKYRHEPASATFTPERVYDRTWALKLFEESLARLRQESFDQGKKSQFEQIKNFLTQEPGPGDYATAATRLGLSPNAVAVAVHRLRQRYAALVRESVAQTVAQASQVEEELAYLISLVCD
jgi:RNA polymerase sigma-70 factor (ECF subfamily)